MFITSTNIVWVTIVCAQQSFVLLELETKIPKIRELVFKRMLWRRKEISKRHNKEVSNIVRL